MRSIAIVGIALASGSLAPVAIAQTDQPTVHHYHHVYSPHHAVHHHHYVAAPAPARANVVIAPVLQVAPLGLALPRIAPFPDGKGDEDGLSEDINDCNKGCVDGSEN